MKEVVIVSAVRTPMGSFLGGLSKEISKEKALEFIDQNHIEGSGFEYKNSTYYGLYYKDKLVMVSIIGQFYNQSSKSFKYNEYKSNTICLEAMSILEDRFIYLLSKYNISSSKIILNSSSFILSLSMFIF